MQELELVVSEVAVPFLFVEVLVQVFLEELV
jgi:hypothetical protein